MEKDSLQRISDQTRNVIELLWPTAIADPQPLFNGDPADQISYGAYDDYRTAQWHKLAPYVEGDHAAVDSPEAIAGLAQDIREGKTWEQLLASLKLTNATQDACERSINLAVRLLVMMRFGVAKHQLSTRRCLVWETGRLQDVVHDQFSEPPKLSCERIRLPKSFDAWSIVHVAGIEIVFTDNLADHLLLVEDDTKLLVFHHASFLEFYRSHNNTLFPPALIDETLPTLALLFPQAQYSPYSRDRHRHHRRRRWHWLQHLQTAHLATFNAKVDPRLARCGTPQAGDRQAERFHFWRDRLVVLKQTYDDATPRTIGQWWRDRRNGVQWYTFWVAILVLVVTTLLSVMQVVLGALQVYKAFEAAG